MLKAVLDTSVLVAGLRSSNGASHLLLRRVAKSKLLPSVSIPLFLEYESVLKRPEHQLATGLSINEIDQFLNAFASAAAGVEIHFRWRPRLKDPKDELVLECVVNSGNRLLVTHNIKDFKSAVGEFDFRVLTPSEYIQEISDE